MTPKLIEIFQLAQDVMRETPGEVKMSAGVNSSSVYAYITVQHPAFKDIAESGAPQSAVEQRVIEKLNQRRKYLQANPGLGSRRSG